MSFTPNYSDPTYLCRNVTTTGVQPNILDIEKFMAARLPVPLQIYISGTATVKVWVSVGIDTSLSTPTLLYAVEVQPDSGAITASTIIDLISGVRFCQVEVSAINPGSSVTCLVGATPLGEGKVATPSLVRMSTNATLGM